MAEVFKLQGTIDVNVNNATSNLKTVQSELQNTGNQARKTGNTVTDLAKSVLASQVYSKIKSVYSSCTTAYNGLRESEAKLATISKQRLNATNSEIAGMEKYAGSLAKTGVVGKTALEAGMAQIASFASQKSSVEKLSQGMLDLAANTYGYNTTAKDMYNIGNMIGKGLAGSASSLTRVGVIMTDNEKKMIENGNETERAATLAKVLEENYGGMNKALEQTPEGQLKRLSLNMAAIKVQLGEVLSQITTSLLPKLTKATTWFNSLDEGTRQNIIIISALVLAVGLGIAAFAKLITSVKLVVDAFKLLNDGVLMIGETIGNIGSGISKLFSLIAANPYILIIVAIVAIVGYLVYLYNTNEEVRNQINDIFDWIKDKVQGIGDWFNTNIVQPIQEGWNALKEINPAEIWDNMLDGLDAGLASIHDTITKPFKDLWSDMKGGVDTAKNNFINSWHDLGENISKSNEEIDQSVSEKCDWLGEKITGAWDYVSSNTVNSWNSTKENISNSASEIQQNVQGKFSTLQSTIGNIWNGLSTGTSNAWKNIRSSIVSAGSGLQQNSKTTFDSVCKTISSSWDTLKSNTSSTWNTITQNVKNGCSNIHTSVQSRFSVISNNIQNAWSNVTKNTSNAWNNIRNTVQNRAGIVRSNLQNTFNSIKSNISNSWGKVKSNTQTSWSHIKSTVSSNVSKVISSIKGWRSLPSTVSGIFESVKDSIWKPLKKAYDRVCGIVNDIKDKLSSISFSGITSAISGIIPHASGGIIKHAAGGIATQATSLGFDSYGNEHVFGEAGAEALLPLDGFYSYLDKKFSQAQTAIDYNKLGDTIVKSMRKTNQGVYMDGDLVGIYSADSVSKQNILKQDRLNRLKGGADRV